ncbi:MAG: superoxide dismutase [Pseudonocardiaceae bacterium]
MRGTLCGDRSHTAWRRLTLVGVGAALTLMPAGLAYQGLSTPTVLESLRPAVVLVGSGTLTTPNTTSKAITYNVDLAPVGAAMTATLSPSSDKSTTVEFTVSGLLPGQGYSVYAHIKACGATPDAAGPRFQNRQDSVRAPSTNSRYPDLSSEIWLDVHTDSAGAGTSRTTVPFVLTDRVPHSIMMHDATQTPTSPGQAVKAGARVACLTLSIQ